MRGAEVALLADTRLKVGSSADCDIVINDASLAPFAFELEVSESAVTLITPDGTQTQMKPLEIRDFGTTAVAVGPADEPWGELVRPAPEAEEQKPEPAAEPAEPSPAADAGKKRRSCGCLLILVVMCLLFLLLAALAWFFWPQAEERWPQLADVKAQVVEFWKEKTDRGQPVAETSAATKVSLKDLAAQHHLTLGEEDGVAVLDGNLRRRTERLAIRALALAADPSCRLRLTDDETMLRASGELLFAYTDGTLKAVAASNGVVTIVGHAPDAAALERALRTLDAEVKGIVRVEASGVQVGGSAIIRQEEPEKVPFVAEPTKSSAPLAVPQVKKPVRNYPIAGILTAPYPCVVMRDGHRVMEGALIGTAVLVKIEADRLVMKDGDSEFEWKP